MTSKLLQFTAPIHCRRDALAVQLIRGAIRILLKDLSYTEEMVISVFGTLVKEVEDE